MFISRIPIDLSNRRTVQALTVPEFLHAAIENCFAGERNRNLWRIDKVGENSFLLIVSPKQADFAAVARQFGENDQFESLSYEPLFKKLKEGQRWSFRLRANPTKSLFNSEKPNQRGKVVAVKPSEQKNWLIKCGVNNGFSVQEHEFDVVESLWKRFIKDKHENKKEVILYTAVYEGILTITDPLRFANTLSKGVGRGKAYGCGMLTIAGSGE